MNGQPTPEQIRAFLLDLRELTMRHGIAIAGCGCCDSPFLDAVNVSGVCGYWSDTDGGGVRWVTPADEMWHPDYARRIVLPEEAQP